MRSSIHDILPLRLRRTLKKFGGDLSVARKKRSLTVAMMAERLAVAKSTYVRVEKGDPSVAFGVYAMAMFVLGLSDAFFDAVDPRRDAQGMLLDVERLPQRVRTRGPVR